MAEKSDVNEEADSEELPAVVLADDGAPVLDDEPELEFDEEPQAASAAAVTTTSEAAAARLTDDFGKKPERRVMPVSVRSGDTRNITRSREPARGLGYRLDVGDSSCCITSRVRSTREFTASFRKTERRWKPTV
jgi:hypothetical protein